MPALARGDAEQVLRLVGEAESLGGDDPFTGDFLVELGRLVPADWIAYNELDRVRRRVLLAAGRTTDAWKEWADAIGDEARSHEVTWSEVIDGNPVCLRAHQGDFSACRISDLLTRRAFHRTRLYELRFRPCGLEHSIALPLPSPLWHTKTFLLTRTDRAFSERDRHVLDVLQPHLARLWRAARTRRLLTAALAGLDHAEADESRGVILLGRSDELEYASAPARRLSDSLPGRMLAEWLESGSPRPLVHRRGARRLTVERVGDTLLLEETLEAASLTAREREVLAWVARGKTNPEIARVLWLAPSTVSKHLEHVYAKLGVGTRAAAVAHFLGVIDPESGAGDVVSGRD